MATTTASTAEHVEIQWRPDPLDVIGNIIEEHLASMSPQEADAALDRLGRLCGRIALQKYPGESTITIKDGKREKGGA